MTNTADAKPLRSPLVRLVIALAFVVPVLVAQIAVWRLRPFIGALATAALSAASNAGPRPFDTIATRLPCGMRPGARMRAAAKSCVYVCTRTVPARIIAAVNTASGATLSGASSERPDFSTTTGLVRAAARSADRNARESRTDST